MGVSDSNSSSASSTNRDPQNISPSTHRTYATFSQPAPELTRDTSANDFAALSDASTPGDVAPRRAGVVDGLKTIKPADFTEVHKKPCVRDALLFGIASGFGVGGLRMVLGGTVWKSMSWAIGTFCFGSAGSFEFCQRQRALERKGMERAAEIIERKRAEKETEAQKRREERKKRREEEIKRMAEEQRKRENGWWKW